MGTQELPFRHYRELLGVTMNILEKVRRRFSKTAPVSQPADVEQPDAQAVDPNVIHFRNMILEKLIISLRNDQPENNLCPIAFRNGEPAPTDYFYHFFANFADKVSKFYQAYQRLSDEASRELFVDLILYRILGHKFIKLPTNNDKHFQDRGLAESCDAGPSSLVGFSFREPLRHFEFDYLDQKIKFDGTSSNVAWSFFIKQYYLTRESVTIKPEQGDYVLDLGACFGDTAITFAADVGKDGKVFSFDFLPAHEKICKFNFAQNPCIAERVVFAPDAVGDVDDYDKTQDPNESEQKIMPGASLVYGNVDTSNIPIITVDTYVKNNSVKKVDYIKMDIEGYELNALKGSIEVLKTFKPKLGISAYHRNEDFYELMNFIHELDLGYRFYFDHYTTHGCETVLYAAVG